MSLSPKGTARLAFENAAPVAREDYRASILDLAKDVARLEPGLSPEERKALAALVLAALAALEAGSTRVPLRSEEMARAGRAFGLEAVEEAIDGLLQRELVVLKEDPEAYVPLIRQGDDVYLQRMLRMETRFTAAFAAKAAALVPVDRDAVRTALAEVRTHPLTMSEEQVRAVEQAAISGLTVISGGPGTGKTSIVVALLRLLMKTGVAPEQVALAAPTGKAAHRMEQAIRQQVLLLTAEEQDQIRRCPQAQTLHRMLGYSHKDASFRHHEGNRLAERVVIIDESSMIDLALMERIFRSVRSDARLVLLGDTDQLPSVDAGAVLRDIRASNIDCTVTLTQSFRTAADDAGQAVQRAAHAANQGRVDGQRVSTADMLRMEGVELLGDQRGFLERWYSARTTNHRDHLRLTRRHYRFQDGHFSDEDQQALDLLFAHQGGFSLLAVTRHLSSGADTANDAIHRMVLRDQRVPATPFLCGEPVMMQRNDYERGIFNGDQGLVLSVAAGRRPHPMAVFRTAQGYEPFHLEALSRDLRLSHAITVHKAQGSEFDHVALLLPASDVPILTRELIYTAITRARRAVTIVGAETMLVAGVTRRVIRHSGLAERLVMPPPLNF